MPRRGQRGAMKDAHLALTLTVAGFLAILAGLWVLS